MRLLKFALLLLLILAPELSAQSQSAVRTSDDRPIHNATLATSSITIDGVLDEPVWADAATSSDFTESYPDPGATPSDATEFSVVYDDEAIYIGLRMYDSSPDSIAAPLARRDAGGIYSDWIHIIIDSFHDRRTAFRFTANPRGVQRDVYTFDDGNEDDSWNAVWEVGTRIDSLGWTAEFRIPLSQLRFHSADDGERVWGFQVMRDIARREQRYAWSPWVRESPGFVSFFGEVHGLDGVRASRRLELQPYVSTRLTREPLDKGNPFYESNAMSAGIGGDLNLGLTPGLTLTATLIPDFGQVEQDPATINLSAFESFFPERRPFFVEGADVFRFGQIRSNISLDGQEFFYSRRIGRTPQRALRGDEFAYVDRPGETTILGAAKVTGKVGAWTIGVMDALTARESATYADPEGELLRTPVEPATNYFLSRVRRDLNEGKTAVGGMLSHVHRDMSGGVFDAALASSAYFGGVDFDHAWGGRTWRMTGYLAGSRVTGDSRAITRLQRAPGKYYQRPDADHVEVDQTLTSLDGYLGQIAVQRSGDWDMSLYYKESSPGFELNDAGFHGRSDFREVAGFLGRRVNERVSVLRDHSYYTFGATRWNHGGDQILALTGVGVNGTFTNLWNFGFEAQARPGVMDDGLTRGGPIASRPPAWSQFARIGTPSKHRVSFGGTMNLEGDAEGGWGRAFSLSADVRPSEAVRLQFEPSVSWSHGVSQYVGTFEDSEADHTFGHRYVFADIDRTTVSLSARVDWTFSPTLSLQLFAQPFIATGDYANYKEFAKPGTFEFDVYGQDRGRACTDGSRLRINPVASGPCPAGQPAEGEQWLEVSDPDFNMRSFQANAVMRWEYRPGSAIFLVWQQQRAGTLGYGDFRFSRDIDGMFQQPSTNVFMIKATYWFGG